MKHIEQITSEQVIDEINRLALSDDMLTTALSEPYAQATGIEVQPSAPVTSDVEEMPSWMTYLLRKMFGTIATVFRGVSLLSEFRAVYSWLRERLKGSADGTIPSIILATNKPMSEHLRLLDNRKISNGNNSEIEDGVSLVRLLASQESLGKITELIDDNKDWIMDSNLPTTLTASVTKATFGFKELEINTGKVTQFFVNSNLEELHLPYAKEIYVRIGMGYGDVLRFLQNSTNLRVLDFPKLETLFLTGGDGSAHGLWNIKGEDTMVFPSLKSFYNNSNASTIYNWADCRVLKFPVMERTTVKNVTWLTQMPSLEELYIPMFVGFNNGKTSNPSFIDSCPVLKKVVLGKLEDNMKKGNNNNSMLFKDCPQVIHFEIGQNTDISLVLNLWNPTYALLTEDLTEEITNEETGEVTTKVTLSNSLVEAGEPFANNREKFLYNFQTFLVDRLADRTGQSALILTLSAEVYAALEAQDGQTILATLTNKNWTVTTA
jgi:hypothetical protein